MGKGKSKSAAPAGPPKNLARLARQLFSSLEEQANFLSAVENPRDPAQMILQLHGEIPTAEVAQETERIAWIPTWASEVKPGDKPGLDSRHTAGDWYVLDRSSVFCASPLLDCKALLEESQSSGLVVDVCAAPGGKAAFAWRALQPRLLVANEVVSKRVIALISNIKRCRVDPCVIVQRDPGRLAQELGPRADVVIVDAPCSGQSLVVKGKPPNGCFHPSAINMNANRQRRILACAAGLVRPGGRMLYSTCTFSPQENEETVDWFLERFPHFRTCELPRLSGFESSLSAQHCYRLLPHVQRGAGGFTCLLESGAESTPETEPTFPHIEWSSLRGKEVLAALLS